MAAYLHDTVRKTVRKIHTGELLIPNIQRNLVWDQEQMVYLLDSLMRGYPISTMLIWRTRQEIAARRFVQQYRDGIRFSDFNVTPKKGIQEYVLDGQQRLQALYISLMGSHNGKEVYLDLLDRPKEGAELHYSFFFDVPENRKRSFGAIRLGDIVLPDKGTSVIKRQIVQSFREAGHEIGNREEDRIEDLVSQAKQVFTSSEIITYFNADAQENPIFRDLDEVLEVFIRVNSGGTKLDWSDLIFSIVKSQWEDALQAFEAFLDKINKGGAFSFDKDDILKSSLVLLGKGAKFDLSRLRGKQGEKNVEEIRKEWPDICRAIEWTMDFLESKVGIRSQKILRSKAALIPIMHFAYLHGKAKTKLDEQDGLVMQRWLYRVLLERQFGGQAVTLLNRCAEEIRKAMENGGRFPEHELYGTLGLPTQIANETILDRGRRSPQESVLPLFVAYLTDDLVKLSFSPMYSGNVPEIDHIVPRSWLRDLYKSSNLEPNEEMINNIGNYRPIEKDENRRKGAILPDKYHNNVSGWKSLHFVPEEFSLDESLSVSEYEVFVGKRRELIFDRIARALR